MRPILPCLLAVLLATACSGSGGGEGVAIRQTGSAMTLASPASRLHREGRWLVDGLDRVVLLHGVNAVWKIAPYTPPDTAEGFTEADADWLASHGFNTVRFGVLFTGVMPERGEIDHTYLERSNRVIQLLTARGIWVMLDFHQDLYNERFQGEGFPAWSVYDDGLPHPVSIGFPGNYFTAACTRAFDNFWANTDNLWGYYRDAWKAVASRWRSQPYLLGYDLLNEPWPGTDLASCANPQGCPLHDTYELQAMQEYVLAGIREVDPHGLVWFEPNISFNSGAKTNLGLLKPLTDPNLGLSWHKYCLPAAVVHAQGFDDVPSCEQLHQMVTDNAEEAIQRMGAATLITEFGASDDLADLEQVTRQADTQLTGWQYWHYKEWHDPTTESGDSGGQGMFTDDEDLGTVKLAKLRILERTYPRATAGIPRELRFDPTTGDFFYRYQPRPARGPTEIYVPVDLHYPNGYEVELQGGRRIGPADRNHLLIEAEVGAPEVVVRLRRRG